MYTGFIIIIGEEIFLKDEKRQDCGVIREVCRKLSTMCVISDLAKEEFAAQFASLLMQKQTLGPDTAAKIAVRIAAKFYAAKQVRLD